MALIIEITNKNLQPSKVILSLNRYFSLSMSANMSKSSEGKVMNKLLGMSKKKRKLHYFDTPATPSTGNLKIGKHIQGSKENNRRVTVLNSLFMKHISDLMSSGSSSIQVLDKGLEISRVAVSPDFKQVNVFWYSNNEKNSAALSEVLSKVGFDLRHELTQLKVVGIVPRVVFVKDRHISQAVEVDHLLKIADYGEDHEPAVRGSVFKSASQYNEVSIASDKKNPNEDKEKYEISSEAGKTDLLQAMPVMRQDTFNLNHDKIMDKIMKSLKKSKAYHRFQPNVVVSCEGTQEKLSEIVGESAKDERKEAIYRFLRDRKVLREKQRQNKHNSDLKLSPDVVNQEEDCNYERFMLDDYIDENEEEKQRYN